MHIAHIWPVYAYVVCIVPGKQNDILKIESQCQVKVLALRFSVIILKPYIHRREHLGNIGGRVNYSFHSFTLRTTYSDARIVQVRKSDTPVYEYLAGGEMHNEVLIEHSIQVIEIKRGYIRAELLQRQACSPVREIKDREELCFGGFISHAYTYAKADLPVIELAVVAEGFEPEPVG